MSMLEFKKPTSTSHKNIGDLIHLYRTGQKGGQKKMSQSDLAAKLGYTTGQFISNIERGLADLPADKLSTVCQLLNIPKEEMCDAVVADYRLHIQSALETTAAKIEVAPEKIAA
jgi:transcriptional regulator with XRE-family HTH domain